MITIHIDVGYRACILLARFLYGKPMWSLDDVEHAKDDLKSLVEIYQKTLHWSFYTWNTDCIDACVDAIEQILVQESEALVDPLRVLEDVIITTLDDSPGHLMIIRQLVHGECAKDGRAKSWLKLYCDGKDTDKVFLEAFCMEFANKAAKEDNAESE